MILRFKDKNDKAYLLVELLIVVVVLGVVIVFISQALSSTLFAARKSASYTRALFFAEAVISDLKLKQALEQGVSKQDFPKKNDLLDNRVRYICDAQARETDFPDLLEVVLNISWLDNKAGGSFEISALIPIQAVK